jgi:hypothetical protein
MSEAPETNGTAPTPPVRPDSSLRVTGLLGSRRLIAPDGTVEFTEHGECGWIILGPVRTWEQWRKLANAILASVPPE